MSAAPTPSDKAAIAQKDANARQLLHHAQSLEKCSGWTHYLKPKIFGAFDTAQENILAAAAKGEPAAAADLILYSSLQPLVTEIRHPQQLALQRVGSPPPLSET